MTEGRTERAEKAPQAADQPTRYAAYDNTLLRFVGGVYGSKADVAKDESVKAAKSAKHDVEIREV